MQPQDFFYITLSVLIIIMTVGILGIFAMLLWILLTLRRTASRFRDLSMGLSVFKDSLLVSALSMIGNIIGRPKGGEGNE